MANLAGSPSDASLSNFRPISLTPFTPTLRHTLRHSSWAVRVVALLLCTGLSLPAKLVAQAVAGVGDDAIPLPKGGYRFLVSGLWNGYDASYRAGADGYRSRPLLSGLRTDQLGVGLLPQLDAAQLGLRSLTGDDAFAISLGALEARGDVRQSIAPIAVDYGITKRVSVRLLVPYVESRDNAQLLLNRNGSGANVGLNPAFVAGTGSAARQLNGAVIAQLTQARSELAAEITRCTDARATACDAIRANPAGVQALLARALTTQNTVRQVYGDASQGGAPVVPIAGSTVQSTVAATIDALRQDFTALGVSAITSGTAPAAATTVLGPAGMSRIATDSAWQAGYAALGNTRRSGIGDIDLTASVLLYDTFAADQARRLLAPTRGVRSMLTAGWRFGTAGADRAEDAFDVPIGDGANALLVRSTTDLVLNRLTWISASVRAALPFSDNIAVALPFRDVERTFSPMLRVESVSRSLGPRVELELAPRLALGQFFGISGAYLMRRWGEDRYESGLPGDITDPMASSVVAARTLQAVAFGVTFSTLASYTRGRSRFPAEVIYTRTVPIGGSGGVVPAINADRLELRVYTGFPRR